MARFSYERFSAAAIESVMATSVLAFVDNVPAEPRHLRRALRAPSASSAPRASASRLSATPAARERFVAAKSAPGSVYAVFTPELRAVLERALELAEGPVEPAHLAAALDS